MIADSPDPERGGGALGPDAETVRRITRNVLDRLHRRRRRIAAMRCGAFVLAVAVVFVLAEGELPERPVLHDAASVEKPGDIAPALVDGEPTQRPSETVAEALPEATRVGDAPRGPREPSPRVRARAFWKGLVRAHAVGGPPRDDPTAAAAACVPAALSSLDPRAVRAVVADIRRGALEAIDRNHEGFASSFLVGLGRSRAPRAWPVLEAVLARFGPRVEVVRAVGELGEERAVPYLRRLIFLGDRRAEAAVAALGRIPGHESLHALFQAAEGLRGGELLAPTVAREVRLALRGREEEISNFVRDPHGAGKAVALRALYDIQTHTAVATLVRSMRDPECRPVARRLLSRIAGTDLGPMQGGWSRWLAARQAKENV